MNELLFREMSYRKWLREEISKLSQSSLNAENPYEEVLKLIEEDPPEGYRERIIANEDFIKDWSIIINEDEYRLTKEPVLYYVATPENRMLLFRDEEGKVAELGTNIFLSKIKYRNDSTFRLTEEEIKGYDEAYWAFAKRIEESSPVPIRPDWRKYNED